MSYTSGFMLGASLGKAFHSCFRGKTRGTERKGCLVPEKYPIPLPRFFCESALSGRRRYRAAALVGNEALKNLLEAYLQRLSGVQKVEASARTGSILLHAGNEAVLDRIERVLAEKIFAATKNGLIGNVPENESIVQGSLYADTAHQMASSVSRSIVRRTDRAFDLSSLLSLFFLLRGLRKMIFERQMPSGPQMIWWAMSLLRRW
ncbi:HMA2 domain-containing protein [Megasphaera vaginalis (ex Bordigoni et al. 2020)]|uniref:HMA2 domain-containing protein n=1 Tax=Megasphaera vaginalis (ex Bordigoni et al. 2020) TaxID=2045301 RepID=UPI000C79E12E|nr:hypothetical protein [Megasphaera vaginalis (ex Bordigoni et al. 2020)]